MGDADMSNPASYITAGTTLFGFNSYSTVATLCFLNVMVLERSVKELTLIANDVTEERQRRHRRARDFNLQRNHADPDTARRVFQLLEEAVCLDAEIETTLQNLKHKEEQLEDLHAMVRLLMRLHEAEERQYPVLRLVRKRAALRLETKA